MAADNLVTASEAKRSDLKKSGVSDELERAEFEPLLPIETKLILFSLVLGAVLMVVLVWVSYTFFKG